MVQRVARLGVALSIVMALLFVGPAFSATTATPTTKPTVKATAKIVAKKKPVAKKPTAKQPVVRKKKVVKVIPTAKPVWPPKGFRANGEIYAKVPTSAELLGILSADKSLTLQAKQCVKSACGVVRVASATGCTWWEITSTVSGPTSANDALPIVLGKLRTTIKATPAKKILTVYLITSEPLGPDVSVGSLSISCYHSPATEKIPSNVYTRTVVPTPTASATETPTQQPSTSASSD